jgi:hypothetical protein
MTGNIALNGNYLSGDGRNKGVFVAANGNVGIGTASPDRILHISGTGQSFKFNNAATDGFSVSQVGVGKWSWSGLQGGMEFHLQNSDFLVPQGSIGIGTTAPDTKLQVAGAVTQEPLSSDPADPDAGNSVQWVSDGTGSGDAGDVMMKINVAGTTKVITLIDYSVA